MQEERIDAAVLGLLNEVPGPWQIRELEREWRSGLAVRDAVGRLAATGLAHRTACGFVFASAAGRHAYRIGEERP